jgi:hypothetical protein
MAISPVSVSEPENTGLLRTSAIRRTTWPSMIWTNGPGFPGPFFLFATHRRLYQHLRQISRGDDRKQYPVASWHIAYKDASSSARNKQERFGRWAVQSKGTVRAMGRKARTISRAASCIPQFHHWPKGADAAPEGPSYNSSLQSLHGRNRCSVTVLSARTPAWAVGMNDQAGNRPA